MVRAMVRLANRAEFISLAVTVVFCTVMLVVLVSVSKTSVAKGFVVVMALGILAAVVIAVCKRLSLRCTTLRSGRCPTPFCHGVVQRSQHVARGYVVCPTCKAKWPEIENIQYKTTWQA